MKTYHIDTLDKLLNAVNEENSDRMAIDLAHWLVWYSTVIQKCRDNNPEETKGKTNAEIARCAFVWTDDHKTGITSFQVYDPDTGEITTFNKEP